MRAKDIIKRKLKSIHSNVSYCVCPFCKRNIYVVDRSKSKYTVPEYETYCGHMLKRTKCFIIFSEGDIDPSEIEGLKRVIWWANDQTHEIYEFIGNNYVYLGKDTIFYILKGQNKFKKIYMEAFPIHKYDNSCIHKLL